MDNPTPNVGDTITYTITLTDNGPDAATSVSIADALPTGLVPISASTSVGSYSSSTGIWTVGSVATGTPETLQIMARVTSPSATTNTATIAHADQFDPDTTNNTASVVVTPQQADLALAKTVDDSDPQRGRHDHLHHHPDRQRPR